MRSLRDQAIWQREATTTVTELLAAAADLESLAEERMRLLRTVTALRRKPKRHVPENSRSCRTSSSMTKIARSRARSVFVD